MFELKLSCIQRSLNLHKLSGFKSLKNKIFNYLAILPASKKDGQVSWSSRPAAADTMVEMDSGDNLISVRR